MSSAALANSRDLPWMDDSEDRGFRWLSGILLVVFLVGGLIINSVELPEVERKQLVDVSPRLAKLILEKQKPPPPPKQAPQPKKEEVKKQEKPPEKKKPEPKKVEKAPPKKSAREVAQQSGLIAMADELADLRDSFALDDLTELPQTNAGKQAVEVASTTNTSDLLNSSATRSSGGIQTDTLNRNIATSELAQRKTTKVESSIESGSTKSSGSKSSSNTQQSKSGTRNADEIERVFQKFKGDIYRIYNRALRKNPSLAGKVVIELTIAPNGEVIAARIVSSELGDTQLERKLVLKVKQFAFSSANVGEITVTYPIDFVPS